jgi:general nucleoside transport system ATP-binding protein
MTDRPTLLKINGLTKAYPGVVANDDVSFSIREGEVHALLGENGAGKSTLVKMIYGLVRPDAGSMTLRGQDYAPSEPRAARAAGVAMVFQHFSLFEALDVAENVALGMENPPPQRQLGPPHPRGEPCLRPAAGPVPAGGRVVGGRAPAGGDHPLPAAGSPSC